MKTKIIVKVFCFSLLLLTSCESEEERQQRIVREEQQKIELEEKRKAEEALHAIQLEEARIKEEKRIEEVKKEQEIYNRYANNSLGTGTLPYAYCFGSNKSCSEWGCSEIKVRASNNSDVLVTIKKGEKVVRHAYLKTGASFTFELPNGTYQPFFYYGKGWNPEKVLKETDCGPLKGGFIENEVFGKDSPQELLNNVLEYQLVLQQNGNFSTQSSSAQEAF